MNKKFLDFGILVVATTFSRCYHYWIIAYNVAINTTGDDILIINKKDMSTPDNNAWIH